MKNKKQEECPQLFMPRDQYAEQLKICAATYRGYMDGDHWLDAEELEQVGLDLQRMCKALDAYDKWHFDRSDLRAATLTIAADVLETTAHCVATMDSGNKFQITAGDLLKALEAAYQKGCDE